MKPTMRRQLKLPVAIIFAAMMVVFAVLVKSLHYQPPVVANLARTEKVPQNHPAGPPPIDLNKSVVDLSAWQQPSDIDYDAMSRNVIGAIVRVTAGPQSKDNTAAKKDGTDTAYKQHIEAFQSRGVPVAVYAYVKGKNESDMKKQADLFYKDASPYKPTYYWLDIEEANMSDLNKGIETFREELASHGVKNIGVYSQDWFINKYNIDISKFSAVWTADYGLDTGYWSSSPDTGFNYDMHQYTDKGTLPGFNGNLDLSIIRTQDAYHKLFGGK